MTTIIILATVGSGMVTGLLFAFSNFIMRALAELPDDKGMFTMQRVNETIINPVFFLLFFGTPLLCSLIAINFFMQYESPNNLLLLLGALTYLIGPFGITLLFNVPLNNQLAITSPSDAKDIWPGYQKKWQRWNHYRTTIGVISIFLLASGLGST